MSLDVDAIVLRTGAASSGEGIGSRCDSRTNCARAGADHSGVGLRMERIN